MACEVSGNTDDAKAIARDAGVDVAGMRKAVGLEETGYRIRFSILSEISRSANKLRSGRSLTRSSLIILSRQHGACRHRERDNSARRINTDLLSTRASSPSTPSIALGSFASTTCPYQRETYASPVVHD